MNFKLLHQVLELLNEFERTNAHQKNLSLDDFKRWMADQYQPKEERMDPEWESKHTGRSANSVINTLIVHMNRYAKNYSKSVIWGTDFTTQEDFIYLINLKAFGEMSKIDLIKKNVHEKSVGMSIIDRLIKKGWVDQTDSIEDKRSKIIRINEEGLKALDGQMNKIRTATQIVVGNLTEQEKMTLIQLLLKLEDFHRPIYEKNIDVDKLLDEAYKVLPK